MKKWLIAYFGLNKKEYNGILVLIMLIGTISLISYVYKFLIPADTYDAASRYAIEQLRKKGKRVIKDHLYGTDYKEKRHASVLAKPFYFDPNGISLEKWVRLGLTERQAAVILNYRSKGGRFNHTEDLQKMYTISERLYERLKPYVRIENRKGFIFEQPVQKVVVGRSLRMIEINTADSAELEEIRGIGPAFASRILKYRERLGGFYKKEQLLEVFGLDSVKYLEIENQILIDESKVRKIAVNTAIQEDFRYHPYIRYKQVNALIQYRKQHGNYSNIAALSNVVVMDRQTIARMTPYFSF